MMKLHFNVSRFIFSYLPLILIVIAPALPYDNFVFIVGGILILMNTLRGMNKRSALIRIRLMPVFWYILYTFFITIINQGFLGIYWSVGVKNIILMLYIFYVLNVLFAGLNLAEFFKFAEWFYIVIGLMGIVEFVVRFPIWEYMLTFKINNYVANNINTAQYRCVNLFAHPIMYAVYLGVGIIFMIYRFKDNIKKLVFIEAILTIDLVSTQSRSSMVALFALAVFAVIRKVIRTFKTMKLKGRVKRFLVVIVLSGSIALLYFLFIQSGRPDILANLLFRFQHMLDAGQAGGEIVRIEVARSIFRYLPSHESHLIFGRGLYSGTAYLNAYPIYKGTWKWTAGIDNQYITLLFESGIIGFVLLGSIFIKEMIYLKKHKDEWCSKCFIIQIFFMMVSFFYESLLFMNTFSLIIILLLAFDVAKHRMQNEKRIPYAAGNINHSEIAKD